MNTTLGERHLIPIRCFTCGKVIANKWETYLDLVKDHIQKANKKSITNESESEGAHDEIALAQKKALDSLGFNRYCCRRMFITQPN